MRSVTHRPEKVASSVRAELARLLTHDVQDPRLSGATVIHVSLTPDLRFARVAIDGVSSDERSVQQALLKATPYLRRRLASALKFRYVPDLKFDLCGASSTVARMQELFSEVSHV